MLGTSTRTSDVLINLGLNPLRRLREVGSPQFGVLSTRAPPSPRCTALTAASCENHGAAPNFGTRVPGILGGNDSFVYRRFLLTLKVADGTAGWPACRAVGQLRGWVE